MKCAVAALALGFALSLTSGAGWACTCIQSKSAAAQIDNADAALIGRVLSNDTYRSEELLGGQMNVTRLKVKRALKGRFERTFTLEQMKSSSCAIAFETGKTYVVLLRLLNGKYRTNVCMSAIYPRSDYEQAARSTR